jgi:aminocarboxymuconate-semialdehyde decarboxylase
LRKTRIHAINNARYTRGSRRILSRCFASRYSALSKVKPISRSGQIPGTSFDTLANRRDYWTDRVAGPAVTFGLGMTTDTAIAASRLVFGGVTADYPALRICLAHGGATFFWALPRIARMWDATNDTTSEELTRNVFADSLVHRTANLTYLCDMIGTGRIVFRTDYPFAPPEDAQGANLAGLADDDAAMITRSNAEVLLAI